MVLSQDIDQFKPHAGGLGSASMQSAFGHPSYNISQYNTKCWLPFSTFDKSHNHTFQITTLQVSILNVATFAISFHSTTACRHKTCNLLEGYVYESIYPLQVHT
jgi:hypothetical protein